MNLLQYFKGEQKCTAVCRGKRTEETTDGKGRGKRRMVLEAKLEEKRWE